MKFRILLFTFILVLVSACNVAEQGPAVDQTKSQNNTGTSNLPNTNQIITFRKDRDSLAESNNTVTAYVEREGTYLPDNQIVHVKLAGSADSNDYASITVDGSPVTYVSGQPDTFKVQFAGSSVSQDIKINFQDDTDFELDEILQLQIVNDPLNSYTTSYPSQMGIIIENEDNTPSIYVNLLTPNPDSGTEGDVKTVQIDLSNASYTEVSVPLRISNASVASSNDHTFVDQTITFPAGVTSQTVNFTLNTDNFNELDELLVLELGSAINGITSANNYQYNLIIQDANADPTYDISVADGIVGEASDTEIVTLTLNLAAGETIEQNIIVPVTVTGSSGNVYNNVDYILSNNYFSFPAGSGDGATSTITVTGLDDSLYERITETIQFTVGDTDFATAATATASVTITDDEAAPVIQFISNNYLTQEGATFYLPITISTAADEPVGINFNLATGGSNATPGTDHSIASSTPADFTIPAGVTNYVYPIMVYTDVVFDQDETIVITMDDAGGSPVNYVGVTNTTITIKEEGTLPSITFDTNNQSSTESATAATMSLTMSAISEYDIDINLTIQDNSTEGVTVDYNAISTSDPNCSVPSTNVVRIAAGQTTCTLDIELIDDALDEPVEQLEVKLQQPNNMVLGTYPKHVINILDNDDPPELFISFDSDESNAADLASQVSEGTSDTVYFHLSEPSGYDIIINFSIDDGVAYAATTPDDYYPMTTGSLVIPAGSYSASIEYATTLDNIYESGGTNPSIPEVVVINLESGTNYSIHATDNQATLSIKDQDGDTPPVLSIDGGSTLDVNENDIVNISFVLSKPSADDIYVEFTVDDTVECNNSATAQPNLYKCANIFTAPSSNLDATNLYSQLDTDIGYVHIPAGSTQGVLSFKIDADDIFELSKHYSGGNTFIRREQFRITITDILDGIAGVSVDGVRAQISGTATDTYVDINIADLNQTPVAYFPNPRFKSQDEAATLLSIPINLTNKAETDVSYRIQIYQQAETNFNLADENDFTFTADSQPDGFLDAFGNLEADTTVLSNDDTNGSPTYLNEGLLYSNASNIIFDGQFLIPAEELTKNLQININNDVLYEGNEQFIVRIVDDSDESTYQWQVHLQKDEYKVTLLESSPYPTLSFSASSLSTSEGTESQSNIQSNNLYALNVLYTNKLSTNIIVSPISQHQEVSFSLSYSGTSLLQDGMFGNNFEFMLNDYFIGKTSYISTTLFSGSTDFSGSKNSNTVTITAPAGTAYDNVNTVISYAKDYRYEPNDKTVVMQLSPISNLNLGDIMTHELTINDDDDPPYVIPKNYLVDNTDYNENYAHVMELILSDSNQYFTGKYITDVNASISFKARATRRSDNVELPIASTNLEFLASNDYIAWVEFNSQTLGIDPRLTKEVDISLADPTEARMCDPNLSTCYNYVTTTSFPNIENKAFEVYNMSFINNDLDVALSYSTTQNVGSELYYLGHTCTYYRGLTSCFGNNNHGQLGRGNTNAFGDDSGENITPLESALNLGQDPGGAPLYVRKMALGRAHSCALFSNGKIKCWGDNTYGQLGTGNAVSNIGTSLSHLGNNLSYVNLGPGLRALDLVAAENSNCALLTNKKIKCWGRNNYGQLGNETSTDRGQASTDMGDNLSYIKISGQFNKITAGANHFCAQKTSPSHTLHCWGHNHFGQLGLNSADDFIGTQANQMATTVVNIDDVDKIIELNAGTNHTCIRYNATYSTFNTRCWGSNYYGQLGIGRLVEAGMTIKPGEDYNKNYQMEGAVSSACMYDKDSGNSCTLSIGKAAADLATTQDISNEELTPNGHMTGNNGIKNKPSNITNSGYEVNLGVDNNQFVQLRYPTQGLAAGESFTCAVVNFTSMLAGPDLTVRCWGSNYVVTTDSNETKRDLGLLNNHGNHFAYIPDYDSDPLGGNGNGYMNYPPAGKDCYDNGDFEEPVCQFTSHLQMIGDSALQSYKRVYTSNTNMYAMGVSWGWNTSNWLNHEMHANSHTKTFFAASYSSATDLAIRAGSHHVCVLPKTGASGTNDAIKCWGANYAGQLGFPWNIHSSCVPKVVGGYWSCGAGQDGVQFSFNLYGY